MAKISNIGQYKPIDYQTAKKKWSTEFIKEQQKRENLDGQVCDDTTLKNVIGKLSSKGNFVANDENDLDIFVSKISGPRCKNSIHINTVLNKFPQNINLR